MMRTRVQVRPVLGLMLGVMLAGWSPGCASSAARAPQPDGPPAAYQFRAGPSVDAPLVVLLPGASGLRILEDEGHYERSARVFAEAGYATLIVDYKAAYRAATDAPGGNTGEKIAWVCARAIEWARRDQNQAGPVAVMAWSLGGEGLWELASDATAAAGMGLRALVAYYPVVPDPVPSRVDVPTLAISGTADDTTPIERLRGLAGLGKLTVVEIEGAHHGFDIETFERKRVVRLLPLVGPKSTIQFDAAGAAAARSRQLQFLDALLSAEN